MYWNTQTQNSFKLNYSVCQTESGLPRKKYWAKLKKSKELGNGWFELELFRQDKGLWDEKIVWKEITKSPIYKTSCENTLII